MALEQEQLFSKEEESILTKHNVVVGDLPDNIKIDDKNNIFVNAIFNLNELWNECNPHIKIGNKVIKINKEQLFMKHNQTLCFYKEGIPKISSQDVFNVSKLSNIYVNININS